MRSLACLLAAALSLVSAAPALADPPAAVTSAQAQAQAQDRFREGREAFKQGQYRRALSLFRESRDLYPVPGTLLNLASCEEKLGLIASAQQHFTEAATQLPERDARKTLALEAVTRLETRVPRLRIELATGIDSSAEVTLDGAPVAPSSLGSALPLDPGAHVVLVKAPGMPEQRHYVVLEEGKQVDLLVERPRPETPRPPDPTRTNADGRAMAGLVVGGVGIVALGAGCSIVMGAADDSSRTGEALTWIGGLTLAAGVAGVGTGIYLMSTSVDSGAAKPSATVGFTPLAGGGALGVRGSF